MVLRMYAPTPERPELDQRHRRWAYGKAMSGELPAEIVANQGDREQLVHQLWAAGWTDVEIAAHTRWTSHTVERIRERLGLAANGEVAS